MWWWLKFSSGLSGHVFCLDVCVCVSNPLQFPLATLRCFYFPKWFIFSWPYTFYCTPLPIIFSSGSLQSPCNFYVLWYSTPPSSAPAWDPKCINIPVWVLSQVREPRSHWAADSEARMLHMTSTVLFWLEQGKLKQGPFLQTTLCCIGRAWAKVTKNSMEFLTILNVVFLDRDSLGCYRCLTGPELLYCYYFSQSAVVIGYFHGGSQSWSVLVCHLTDVHLQGLAFEWRDL